MPSNIDLSQWLKPGVVGSSAVVVYVLAQAWVESIQADTRIALELVTEQASTIAQLNVEISELRSSARRAALAMESQAGRLDRIENVILTRRSGGSGN